MSYRDDYYRLRCGEGLTDDEVKGSCGQFEEYRRSDERIREDVDKRLARHPYLDESRLEVGVANGLVVLRGIVGDREQRRLAEAIVDGVCGVYDVENDVKVRSNEPAWPP